MLAAGYASCFLVFQSPAASFFIVFCPKSQNRSRLCLQWLKGERVKGGLYFSFEKYEVTTRESDACILEAKLGYV